MSTVIHFAPFVVAVLAPVVLLVSLWFSERKVDKARGAR